MPSVERNFLHGSLIDHLAYGSCGSLNYRSVGGDVDLLFERANLKLEILIDGARHLDAEIADGSALKPRRLYFHRVHTGGQSSYLKVTTAISLHCALNTSSLIAHNYSCVRHNGPFLIRNGALKRRRRLTQRCRGDREEQSYPPRQGKYAQALHVPLPCGSPFGVAALL